jgi:myo-inositol-1(or 4)-monophosphatase
MQREDRLRHATAIVEAAGEIARRLFQQRTQLAMHAKGPRDFVSEADLAVERVIRERLGSAFPGESVLGEELGGELAPTCWLVDPIDGTANFLRGSPLWGISLGLVVDGEPVVGAIHYPILGMSIGAALGLGLVCNGLPMRREVPFPEVRAVAMGENAHWDAAEIAQLSQTLRQHDWSVASYRCATIGLGFAALGYVDGYLERHTSLWDIAASIDLCREAGLETHVDGVAKPAGMDVMVGTRALVDVVTPLWQASARNDT